MTSVSALGSSQISSEITTVETRLQAPVTELQNQVATEQADISAWGNISGSVSTLAQALSNIKNIGSINSRSVTTTDNTKATATASNAAATGTYSLTNISLAKSQEIYSNLLGSGAATLSGGTGALVFTVGGKADTIAIGSGSLTLNGVAAAVNKAADGVKASVIGTSTGARLVLASSGTGSSAAFTVSGTGALAQFDYNPSSAHSGEVLAQSATNASVTLNGVPITSSTNSLGSAVAGVTIALAGSGNAVVSVSSSPSNLSGSVQAVATSLNAAVATITKETKFTPPATTATGASSGGSAGPLLGNFSATELKNELLTSVSQLVASGVSAGAAGLSVSGSGTVSFNATSFASEYAKNPTAVQNLVSGLYTSLNGIANSALGTSSGSANGTVTTKTTGIVAAATNSLNGLITSIDAQVTQVEKQNAAQLKLLQQEYTVAESNASNASITQTYLGIFLGSGSSSKTG
jgi:flagellar hook-associated protein 2